jgi:ABC-2 type transport system permease protein
VSVRAADIRRTAKAFPTLLRVGLSEVVAYRAEFLIWILTTNMPLVMLAIWHAVAATGPVGRFDQGGFTAYFLAVLVVRLVTSTWVVWQMSMEIRDGTLAAKLLRPVHPLFAYAAEHLAAVPMRALTMSPIVVLLAYSAGGRLAVHDPVLMAVLAASLLGAWLLLFFVNVLLGSLAFFVDSALGIFELWLAVYSLTSGYLIPLELLGPRVQTALNVLPFRFMLDFPVRTLIGQLSHGAALRQLGFQWAYVFVMGAGALAVWRAGVRRFAAFGG